MPWIVLGISAVLEAVWATALGQSDGLTERVPTLVFLAGLAASMVTLAYAARHIPIGIAYAIWAGSGAALTAGWAMVTGEHSADLVQVLLLGGIIACIVGLKLSHSGPAAEEVGDGVDPPEEPGGGSSSFLLGLVGLDLFEDKDGGPGGSRRS